MATQETHFLNVDLDIYSRKNLDALVAAFGQRVVVLFAGKNRRTYEAHLEISAAAKNPDRVIRAFVRLIQALPPSARRDWNAATHREFSIGIQAGAQPNAQDFLIDAATIALAAKVNAAISITIYA